MQPAERATLPVKPSKTRRGKMGDRKRVAAIIRDYLARERVSREQFAFKSKLGKSTVDKLLIGLFSDRTLSISGDYTKLPLRTSPHPEQPATPRTVLAAPDAPSIAVLPFTNMSGDVEQD